MDNSFERARAQARKRLNNVCGSTSCHALTHFYCPFEHISTARRWGSKSLSEWKFVSWTQIFWCLFRLKVQKETSNDHSRFWLVFWKPFRGSPPPKWDVNDRLHDVRWSTYRNVLDTFFDDRWIEARKMREFSRADRLRRKSFVRLRCKQWTNACWRFVYSQMTLLLKNSLPDINASQRWWSLAYDICIYTYTCIHMYLCVCMYVWIYVHVYICSLHNEQITKYACPTQSGWKGFASL